MKSIKDDFPLIKNLSLEDKPYIFLDSASTTLKPDSVIQSVSDYYHHCGANVHRGNYRTSELASMLFEGARSKVAQFVNCKKHEVIFTKGTSDGINYLTELLKIDKSDTVINCIHDHHANYIPWEEKSQLITLQLNSQGLMDLNVLEETLITNPVKLVTISHASNVSGNVHDLNEIIQLSKKYGALICVDAAQSIAHLSIDLSQLESDFLLFSGHKMFAPSGAGVLFIRESLHPSLHYSRFGGGMVDVYTPNHKRYKRIPQGLEPGTPAIEAVIGLGTAIDYIQSLGLAKLQNYLSLWSKQFLSALEKSQFELAFTKSPSSLSIFTLKYRDRDLGFENLARILSDTYNIAVSEGLQCCGPLYHFRAISSGLRISAQIYNTLDDIDRLFDALEALEFMKEACL